MSSRASPTSSRTVAVHSQEPGDLYRSPPVVAGNESEARRPYPTTTEKSDLPESSREASEWLRRSLCSEGAGQEERGTEEHGPDEEPTGRVRRKPAHEKSSTRTDRTSDGAPASPHHRCSAGKPLLFEEVRRAGRRRDDPDRIISAGREDNLSDLHSASKREVSERCHRPGFISRRGMADSGRPALHWKQIVQAAVVAILAPISEAEFLGCSYGFRPKRSEHQVLDAVECGIGSRRIIWVLDWRRQIHFRQSQPILADPLHRTSDWRSTTYPVDRTR